MIHYAVLTSGSCGNSYVFYDGKDAVLVDMGLTLTGLKRRLDAFSIPFEAVRALFVTHLHPDHVKGAGVFSRATHLPVYISQKAINGEKKMMEKLKIDEVSLSPFAFQKPLSVGDFILTPFATSHDSAGSCCYRIEHTGTCFFLLTDSGIYSEELVTASKGASILFLESNYDEEMLVHGAYPLALKRRVAGERGHLSNMQAQAFLKDSGFSKGTVYFVHLSDNNNTIGIVEAEAKAALPQEVTYTVCERGQSYDGKVS